jgi:protein-L-isoaspartate(D-aspartate) O-methyltransferase
MAGVSPNHPDARRDEAGAPERRAMVEEQVVARGLRSPAVVAAIARVPRERFVPPALGEFAQADSALPIARGRTVPPPHVVAAMCEAARIEPGDRVLEIGTGAGYTAAVAAEIADEVWTVERDDELAAAADLALHELGYENVHVRTVDDARGLPHRGPYDAILVEAGTGEVPVALREQLAIGGRLVIATGSAHDVHSLVRITRLSLYRYARETLAEVTAVPLLSEPAPPGVAAPHVRLRPGRDEIVELVARKAEPFVELEAHELDPLLARLGGARVVLLGAAVEGAAEVHRLRERITRALIERYGFEIVAIEADHPDAARIDRCVGGRTVAPAASPAFQSFPAWIWRNAEVRRFMAWLAEHNRALADPARRVRVHGLDLYGSAGSTAAALHRLDALDPIAAAIARQRYGRLTPWSTDPSAYAAAALTDGYRWHEREIVAMLEAAFHTRASVPVDDEDAYLDALERRQLRASAAAYYRALYYGGATAWNLRASHMFETLEVAMAERGPTTQAIVWGHAAQLGDARFTRMRARTVHSLGQLCRERFGTAMMSVGFGSHEGTLAAARTWGGPIEAMDMRPASSRSYEHVLERADIPRFVLPLRQDDGGALRRVLMEPLLQRMVGPVYRPHAELAAHYCATVLAGQFDEYVWLHRTQAIETITSAELLGDATS